MRKERKHYTAEEKVAIVSVHSLGVRVLSCSTGSPGQSYAPSSRATLRSPSPLRTGRESEPVGCTRIGRLTSPGERPLTIHSPHQTALCSGFQVASSSAGWEPGSTQSCVASVIPYIG